MHTRRTLWLSFLFSAALILARPGPGAGEPEEVSSDYEGPPLRLEANYTPGRYRVSTRQKQKDRKSVV